MVVSEVLKPHEKATLEVGFYTVAVASTAGLAIGSWPGWSVAVALVAYLLWVIAYSEATVRVTLRSRATGREVSSD